MPLGAAVVIFAVHSTSSNITSFDSSWYVPTARSLIAEGDTNLNEFADIVQEGDYRLETAEGNLYTIFPVGTPLLAVPVVALVDKILFPRIDDSDYLNRNDTATVERFVASVFVTLAAVCIFSTAYCLTGSLSQSLLAMLVFAFCTAAWSTASRALWQHGPSMLMLALTMFVIVRSKKTPGLIALAGLTLALSYTVRPTNSLSVLILSLYVMLEHRQYFLRYLFCGAVVAVPFIIYNFTIYGAILPPYYMPARIGSNPDFVEALAGNLISPSRGLLLFSPVLLFAVHGVGLRWSSGYWNSLDLSLLVIIILHLATVSSFPQWWAGHSFGPRFMSDVLPYLIYFLLPAISRVASGLRRGEGRFYAGSFLLCMTLSFYVHFRGATSWSVYDWNTHPTNIDAAPERLWDWSDPQFLRR
ncbi:MAG: hypothetical protein WD180_12845 [Pseudohongiellaceae bacterium]